ncbi:MAG: NAD(P)H-hydrate dehydratase [Candidatus Geothermarchaeales archaeon]
MSLPEVTAEYVSGVLPARKEVSRKGQNGRVLVVGGSPLYHGAPIYAGLAAYRTGVDLVYLAVPRPLVAATRSLSPSFIVVPLPDVKLTMGCVHKLTRQMARRQILADSVVIGPGIGRGRARETATLARRVADRELGLVLDADSLHREVLEGVSQRRVVATPHDGEFLRVFGEKVGEDLGDRASRVGEAAKEMGSTILLKGRIDVISDGQNTMVNRTGNCGMTVGGTGDILSGIVAGLLSKGIPPLEAAAVASWINGAAGDLAYGTHGFHFLSEDVVGFIPQVMKPFDRTYISDEDRTKWANPSGQGQ